MARRRSDTDHFRQTAPKVPETLRPTPLLGLRWRRATSGHTQRVNNPARKRKRETHVPTPAAQIK